MTGIPDELIEKATDIANGKVRPEWYDVPKIIDALLERMKAAEGDTPSGFWSQREWEDWSNELAMLIPEDDDSKYANPEGAQESIILDCFKAYVADRDALAAKVADAGELIAQAIEDAAPRTRPGGEWDSNRSIAAAYYRAAEVARAALTEGEKP